MTTPRRKRGNQSKSRGMILFVVAVLLLLAVVAGRYLVDRFYHMLYPLGYEEWITMYSQEYDLPTQLVYSVVKCESSFDPDAVSSVGARGLMQLMEEAFDWTKSKMGADEAEVEYDDMFDPQTNIRYGTKMLSLLKSEFVDTKTTMAAYHAGWGAVKSWLDDPAYSDDGVTLHTIPYDDTAYYVDKVMKTIEIYENLYEFDE